MGGDSVALKGRCDPRTRRVPVYPVLVFWTRSPRPRSLDAWRHPWPATRPLRHRLRRHSARPPLGCCTPTVPGAFSALRRRRPRRRDRPRSRRRLPSRTGPRRPGGRRDGSFCPSLPGRHRSRSPHRAVCGPFWRSLWGGARDSRWGGAGPRSLAGAGARVRGWYWRGACSSRSRSAR